MTLYFLVDLQSYECFFPSSKRGIYFAKIRGFKVTDYNGVEADPSGKDICRACFLPYDPDAFLNPLYIEDNYNYDITRFL